MTEHTLVYIFIWNNSSKPMNLRRLFISGRIIGRLTNPLPDNFKTRAILLEHEEINELLVRFLKFREKGKITRYCARQVFLPIAMEIVSELSPSNLGEICEQCKSYHNKREDYRDATLVTKGDNLWSAIFFDPCETGTVALQKLATAALLSELAELATCSLAKDCQGITVTCTPTDILSSEEITELDKRHKAISAELGW
ncbi:MAG: hypothetical protein RLZZ517_251 [Candidatus Parcubacteria bacterium]